MGFEPMTACVEGRSSSPLSYARFDGNIVISPWNTTYKLWESLTYKSWGWRFLPSPSLEYPVLRVFSVDVGSLLS
jgi:hypothetical protein